MNIIQKIVTLFRKPAPVVVAPPAPPVEVVAVPAAPVKKRAYRKVTRAEMRTVRALIASGSSARAAALAVGRHPPAIYYQLNRRTQRRPH